MQSINGTTSTPRSCQRHRPRYSSWDFACGKSARKRNNDRRSSARTEQKKTLPRRSLHHLWIHKSFLYVKNDLARLDCRIEVFPNETRFPAVDHRILGLWNGSQASKQKPVQDGRARFGRFTFLRRIF